MEGRGIKAEVRARATELVQTIASSSSHNHITEEERKGALDQFAREPQLRHAVTTHFARVDEKEDLICDALTSIASRLNSEETFGAFAASFLPAAVKQVLSGVHNEREFICPPLHKFVICANNKFAQLEDINAGVVPDLKIPSRYHKPKPHYSDLKKHEGSRTSSRAKLVSGEVVNACIGSEVFVGAISCFVYFIRSMDAAAHLDLLALCIYMFCRGIKSLEYKVQVIVGKLRRDGSAQEQVFLAKLISIYKGEQGVRYAVTSDMYVVISEALAYLAKNQKDELVQEMCTYACYLMNERAMIDMNSIGIMLSECINNEKL